MPRLLTRISTSANCAVSAAQPSLVPRSKAAAHSFAFGAACLILAIASSTAALSRPLTMTSAPMPARPAAVAKPMPRVDPVISASLPVRSRSIRFPCLFLTCLFRRRLHIDLPRDRGAGMALEEALRGHDLLLGIRRVFLHPLLAHRQAAVGLVADADEAEALGLLERGQARRPDFAGCERRGMIRTVERHGLADLGGPGDHGPARAKALMPGIRQFAG